VFNELARSIGGLRTDQLLEGTLLVDAVVLVEQMGDLRRERVRFGEQRPRNRLVSGGCSESGQGVEGKDLHLEVLVRSSSLQRGFELQGVVADRRQEGVGEQGEVTSAGGGVPTLVLLQEGRG
jgi:hypothetical protein